jgi:hypothetical protein
MRYLKPLVPVALMIMVAGAARAETAAASTDHGVVGRQDAPSQAHGATETACAPAHRI